jgi:hypothetical protein
MHLYIDSQRIDTMKSNCSDMSDHVFLLFLTIGIIAPANKARARARAKRSLPRQKEKRAVSGF